MSNSPEDIARFVHDEVEPPYYWMIQEVGVNRYLAMKFLREFRFSPQELEAKCLLPTKYYGFEEADAEADRLCEESTVVYFEVNRLKAVEQVMDL